MAKSIPLPTQERLQELFDYSIVEGNFYWKERPSNNVDITKPAGYLHKATGYHLIRIDGRGYRAHRLVWMYITGEDPGELQVDHINGDRSNNAFHNLQLLTNKQNSTKKHTLQGGSSKYRGVVWHKQADKWQAQAMANGRQNYFGCYSSEREAATIAWLYAHKIFHKEHCTYEMP